MDPFEQEVIQRESGGRPYIGWLNTDLTPYVEGGKVTKHGFPDWPGLPGPKGISTAGGLYGITKTNWEHYAPTLGVSDFSPASQKRVFDAIRADQGENAWRPYWQPEGYYGGALHLNVGKTGPGQSGIGSALDDLLLLGASERGGETGAAQKQPDLLDWLLASAAAPGAQEAQTATPIAPEPVPATQRPPERPETLFQPDMPLDQPATIKPAGPEAMPAIPEPEAQGQTPLDTLLSLAATINPIGSAQAAERLTTANGQQRPREQQQFFPNTEVWATPPDALEQLLTMAGTVPSRETDATAATRQAEQAKAPQEPLLGFERGEFTGRVPALAEAVTPYLAGGAPGGRAVLGSGSRLPARIEPPALRTEAGGGTPLPPRGTAAGASETRALPAPEGQQTTASTPPSPTQITGGAGAPPAVPPGQAVGAAAPPPPGPGPVPHEMVGAETAAPRPPQEPYGRESPAVRDFKLEAMRETQDDLYRLWSGSEEYKTRVLDSFRDLPRLSPEEKLQVEAYLEWRPGMPQVAAPSGDAMSMIEQVIKPAQRAAAKDFAWLKNNGVDLTEEGLDAMTQGYVHRVVAGKGVPGKHPFEPFGGQRSMRQRTASMRERTRWFVLQDGEGNRVFNKGETLDRKGYEYGQKIKAGDKEWTVERPTMAEIEANTDTRYLHDPVLASLQNMVQLRIARRNVEALKGEILPKLDAAGLATTSRDAATRLGMKETQIPALRGNFFDPRLANAFDDFYRAPRLIEHPFAWLDNINRVSIASMFLNPTGHMRNVLSDYILARGGLWASPPAYARQGASIRAAVGDILSAGIREGPRSSQFYRDVLKAGGALQGASHQNRILYQALIDRARDEMSRLPNIDAIAKETGLWQTGKEWGQAIWNASQTAMWAFHDALLLARVRELMASKGLGVESAVREAERFIADYRVPASIGEGGKVSLNPETARFLSRLMQDRTITVFGRYHYDKLKALANVVRDAGEALKRNGKGPHGDPITKAERVEAMGRLSALLVWSTVLQFGVNFAIQQATGNPEARLAVPGAAGIPANAARVAADLYRGQFGQANFDFWMGLASIITPLPAIAEGIGQLTNTDYPLSNRPIAGDQLPAAQRMTQRATHAAKALIPPVGEALRMIEGRGAPSLGLSLPDPAAVQRGRQINPREYRRQERQYQRNYPWIPW